MANVEREVLLDGTSLSDTSRVFQIPVGSELTLVGLGLVDDEDYVHFELIYAPGMKFDSCDCPPAVVQPPVVTAKSVLQFNGTPVVITAKNPVVVLTAPQGQPMRAVRHIKDENDRDNFRLTMEETRTPLVNTHLLGMIPIAVNDSASETDMEGRG